MLLVRLLIEGMKQEKNVRDNQKQKDIQQAWDTFREMGKDAVEGQLSDTSINHDPYLYGGKSNQ